MALRRGGYYIQITEVVGGFVTVQNYSAERAFCETVHVVHFHLQLFFLLLSRFLHLLPNVSVTVCSNLITGVPA